MAETKPEKDYRKIDQPKVESRFSDPNDLQELLDDLTSYEEYLPTDNLFQSEKGDRLVREKRKPYEDSEKATKVAWGGVETTKNLGPDTTSPYMRMGLDNVPNPHYKPPVPTMQAPAPAAVAPLAPKPVQTPAVPKPPSKNPLARFKDWMMTPDQPRQASDESNRFIKDEDVKNISNEELDEILKDSKAYEDWLGVNDYTGFKDNPVDTEKFPMDDEPKIR